ncbi:PTS glucose transporter subunit IIA [Alteromonas flava]|uniref:PTS glucose transporter subunit IIA n=1 Tax=Alteromonas flava TaxID=2048003 RepID=UPI000C2920F5|nr:PTS glucose transporter subunit IIA [Alteromonas flava]
MADAENARALLTIPAPCTGTLHPLTQAPAHLYALGLLGRGAYIRVSGYQLFAPFDARILAFSATGDEIKLKANNGLQLALSFCPSVHALHGVRVKRHYQLNEQIPFGACFMDFDPPTWRQINADIGLVITVLNPVRSIELNVPQAIKGKQILALTDTLMTIQV